MRSFVAGITEAIAHIRRRPSEAKSLEAARELLAPLSPATTNDAQTLTLWAAIHQRRWDRGHDLADLTEALGAFERSFVLKVDHYNAAHLAYLLQVRAAQHLKAKRHDDALADWVQAQRLWRDAQSLAEPVASRSDATISARYWAGATMWQAAIALADSTAEKRWQRRTQSMTEVSARKLTAATSQASRLRGLTDELVNRLGPVHAAANTS